MGIVAFCTAVSNGLFGLLDSGYGQTELTFYLTTLTMLGKIMDAGGLDKTIDVAKANMELSLYWLATAYIIYA